MTHILVSLFRSKEAKNGVRTCWKDLTSLQNMQARSCRMSLGITWSMPARSRAAAPLGAAGGGAAMGGGLRDEDAAASDYEPLYPALPARRVRSAASDGEGHGQAVRDLTLQARRRLSAHIATIAPRSATGSAAPSTALLIPLQIHYELGVAE